jgi:hypothetical protein
MMANIFPIDNIQSSPCSLTTFSSSNKKVQANSGVYTSIPHRTTQFAKKHLVQVLVPDPYGIALCYYVMFTEDIKKNIFQYAFQFCEPFQIFSPS